MMLAIIGQDRSPRHLGFGPQPRSFEFGSSFGHVIKKLYHTKRKATEAFRQIMPIQFDSILPRWNDTAIAEVIFFDALSRFTDPVGSF